MLVLYTILYLHLLPFIVLRLFWRSKKAPAYRQRISERFALIPMRKGKEKLIWVHAVSVGEVIAAIPLVKALQEKYPEHRICITTMTPTGSERVKAAFAESVLHYYLPYDLPSLIARFIAAIRPSLLIIMETELWPNLLMVCEEKGIASILANARLSERSAKGYARFTSLTKPMLQRLSLIAAQSSADAERFIAVGAEKDSVHITGSIKFDIALTEQVKARYQELKQTLAIPASKKVAIFASTHSGEDEQLLPMIKRLQSNHPDLLAFIVPRHPERFPVVAELAAKQGLKTVSVSDKQTISPATQLILGDTMGDMLAFYGLADLAFIGGSLIEHGGHNMLEPALWALPMISGCHVFNFQTISDNLCEREGLLLVDDIQQLEQRLSVWLSSNKIAANGENAQQFLQENQGALQRLMELIEQCK